LEKIPPEWTARYWQWIFSDPAQPLKSGVVYDKDMAMLPCTGGGAACDRKAEIQAGKDILVPVFAAAEYGKGEYFLREKARAMSTPINMECSVDDIAQDWEYIETKFNFGKHEAVSAGYWHRLHLSPGKHIIKFGGNAENGFFTKVAYEISAK
jgi:hypothetical protein